MVNIFLHLPPFPLSLSPFFYLSQSKINVNLPYFLKWSHWDKWFYCNLRGFIHKFWYICCFSIIKCKHMLLFHKFNELVYQLKFEKSNNVSKLFDSSDTLWGRTMIHFNFPYLRIKKMNSRSKEMLSVFVIQISLVLHFTNIHLAPKRMYRKKTRC